MLHAVFSLRSDGIVRLREIVAGFWHDIRGGAEALYGVSVLLCQTVLRTDGKTRCRKDWGASSCHFHHTDVTALFGFFKQFLMLAFAASHDGRQNLRVCYGLGYKMEFDEDLMIPDKSLSIAGGGLRHTRLRPSVLYNRPSLPFHLSHESGYFGYLRLNPVKNVWPIPLKTLFRLQKGCLWWKWMAVNS